MSEKSSFVGHSMQSRGVGNGRKGKIVEVVFGFVFGPIKLGQLVKMGSHRVLKKCVTCEGSRHGPQQTLTKVSFIVEGKFAPSNK